MILGSLKQLFSSIQQGIVSTVEGQRHLHVLCTKMQLNPVMHTPIAMLMVTEEGKQKLERYEHFMMGTTWLVARVAAADVSIEEAAVEIVTEIQKLATLGSFLSRVDSGCPCCGENLGGMYG